MGEENKITRIINFYLAAVSMSARKKPVKSQQKMWKTRMFNRVSCLAVQVRQVVCDKNCL
jgi:hypothetical protein